MAAELVFTGGVVRTGLRGRAPAEAVAVTGGRIVAVGSAAEVRAAHVGPGTEVRDLAGAAVYPGFVDVHNHHAIAGVTDLYELSFGTALGLDEILDRVRAHAESLPSDAWITGGSWASTLMTELDSSAVRGQLDEAAGGRPVMLSDDSHHNRWVNTRALELAGIRPGAVPDEGVTLLDAVDGTPTGVLLEGAGIPVARARVREGALTNEQHRRASARGIEILAALQSLDDAGDLHAWVVSSLTVNDEIFGYDPVGEALIEQGERFRTAHHRPDFVKIFLDGVPPARTALLLEPYAPDDAHGAHFHGTTTMSPEELYAWLHSAAARGLGAKVHCTGDGSARMMLNTVERLRDEGFTATRFQIAHGQFLADDDIARLGRLGVTADISPFLWFPGVIPHALATALGAQRAERSQPNRAIIETGGLVAGGTDWPVSESPNPLEGIQGLVTRADPLRRQAGVLWPEQAITAEEALEVFTINGARAMGLAEETGSIETGKSADLVILDRDVIAGDPDAIIEGRVLETWFAGRCVHTA